ncbi:ABC transporter substrate-binding protein [Jiella sp. MQZ9-1]|uniref:ABC transporter substrate-binding protein n=1 Tax=Jiella flava TaxID=2816857 RepID=A0A939G2A6_9HYPH|nr:ABC transporter substrate-binding protein [Jiella flava]MBO0664421.1 ABC transporter substrate-binding protein [Jiella flava]MCD2473057.1 ABC transporter substrate-binding protein [Jiella flava]
MAGQSFIRAGYVPLLDSAVLIAAASCGFAEERGVILSLHRETSWATIRDRIGVGQFDCAHMLAPMPIAANLGIGPLPTAMVAPMVLALGGNGVVVSERIAQMMTELAPSGFERSPRAAGKALAAAVARRAATDERPLRFAVVHPHSSHNYDLRYWLAACGVTPERDVEITVVPPPLMPDALAGGAIDGFCAGEPWATVAVTRGAGRIVTSRAEIWRRGPEKVLGLRADFAQHHPEELTALIAALCDAARWCSDRANFEALARLLAVPERLNVDEAALIPGLTGRMEIASDSHRTIDDFMVFAGANANRPDPGHGRWLYRQMVRWQDAIFSDEGLQIAGQSFDPRFFDEAMAGGGGLEATGFEGARIDPRQDGSAAGRERPDGLFDAADGE